MLAPKVAQTKEAVSSTSRLARQRSMRRELPFGGAIDEKRTLQRSIGNQATIRLLAQRTKAAKELDGHSQQQVSSDTTQPRLTLQPKLVVGEVNDPLEHEADRVADQLMRMPDPESSIGASALQLSRAYDAVSPAGQDSQEAPPIVHQVLDQTGRPLDASSRAFFEPRLGMNLGHVRLHDDALAAQSTRKVGALAYTVGNHIALAKGVDTTGESGRRLLAHELTHVVQQSGGTGVVRRLIREPYPWQGIITPTIGANVRSSPDSSDPANILDSIPKGQTVTVLSATNGWLKIQSHYRGPLLEGYIHNSLVDDATAVSMAGSVGTTMVWKPSGPGSGTDFQSWAAAATETPFPAVTATTVMNCWESVLLSAYRAGALTWTWIHKLYTTIPMADWVTAMSRGALHNYAVPGPNAAMPQRGDMVFFNGIAHVALATGTGSEVYTFWPPPNTPFAAGGTTDKVKVFTIEALFAWWSANMPPAPTVQFGAPKW